MLEESIEASPNSLNSSIRRRREHRKMKRARLRSNPVDNQKLLQMLYDDESEDSISPLTQENSYKRFEAENRLANADRFDVSFMLKTSRITQSTQEFWTCERLMERQSDLPVEQAQISLDNRLDTTFLSCQSEKQSCPDVENLNINFESEWILEDFENEQPLQAKGCRENQLDASTFLDQTLVPNACDRTLLETVGLWDLNTEVVDLSPKERPRSKTIVDEILEDFCSSPNSSETELDKPNSDDIMPFFRFRRKKIRTYERCWRHAARHATRNLEIFYKPDDDGLSDGSESSELSVQEDKSQVMPTVEPLEHLNTSSRIRNNLLNLSAFFTQNVIDCDEAEETSKTTHLPTSEDASDTETVPASCYEGIQQLIREILTLREKYPISYGLANLSVQCDENFHGFFLADENSDYVSEPQNRNIVCQSAPTIMLKSNFAAALSPSKNTMDYADNTKNHQINVDEDSWQHDTDFFANFQTQVVLQATNGETARSRRKSDSTLNLVTTKPSGEQSTLSKVMSDCTDCARNKLKTHNSLNLNTKQDSNNSQCSKNPYVEENAIESQIPVEDILQLFAEPQKSETFQLSNKNFEASKVLEMNFDCMLLSEWPLDEKDEKYETDNISSYVNPQLRSQAPKEPADLVPLMNPKYEVKNHLRNTMKTESKTNINNNNKKEYPTCSTGLHTVSRKPINTSEEALKNNEDIFAQLLDLPDEQIVIPSKLPDFPSEINGNKPGDSTCFTGFHTASRKPINVSEEARKKTVDIFAQLPDLPDEEPAIPSQNTKEAESMPSELQNFLSVTNKNKEETSTCFTGFHNASRKPINVSEEARKKTVDIFAQLPDLPDEEPAIPSQNTKEAESMPSELQNFPSVTNKNKEETSTCFTGFHTASRKPINVSEEARKKTVDIFAQLPDLPDEEPAIPSQNTKEAESMPSELQNFPSVTNKNKEETSTCFTGFHTASRKPINVSEEARKKTVDIFAQLPDLPDDISDLSQNTKDAESFPSKLSDFPNETNRNKAGASTSSTGFHTASRKSINVSEDARKKYIDILAHLPDLPVEQKETSSHIRMIAEKNKCNKDEATSSTCISDFNTPFRKRKLRELPVVEDPKTNLDINQLDNFEDLANFPLSEWIPSCMSLKANQTNEIKIEKNITMKRRLHSIDNAYNSDQPTKFICGSHTVKENSTHTPIINNHITNSKVIARKNLLSLTKRRRESLRTENNMKRVASEDTVETPVKLYSTSCLPKNVLTPHTPQVCAFYAELPTASSTPQQLNNVGTSVQTSNNVDNLESDFKRINWENNDDCQINNVATPTRANNSELNKSLKSQPSPQERIENLSSCGDPPPLLQLVDNNSRSRKLGLSRRWRDSLLNK